MVSLLEWDCLLPARRLRRGGRPALAPHEPDPARQPLQLPCQRCERAEPHAPLPRWPSALQASPLRPASFKILTPLPEMASKRLTSPAPKQQAPPIGDHESSTLGRGMLVANKTETPCPGPPGSHAVSRVADRDSGARCRCQNAGRPQAAAKPNEGPRRGPGSAHG